MSRYAIEHPGNPHCFQIHVDVAVPEMNSWRKEKMTEEGAKLKAILEEVPGITEASSSNKHCLTFYRGGTYTINELLPTILAILETHFPDFRNPEQVEAFR